MSVVLVVNKIQVAHLKSILMHCVWLAKLPEQVDSKLTEISTYDNRVSAILDSLQWLLFTENLREGTTGKPTFRHTIIPVQLAPCLSLVVQGNNESQGILPTVKEQLSVSENEEGIELCSASPFHAAGTDELRVYPRNRVDIDILWKHGRWLWIDSRGW